MSEDREPDAVVLRKEPLVINKEVVRRVMESAPKLLKTCRGYELERLTAEGWTVKKSYFEEEVTTASEQVAHFDEQKAYPQGNGFITSYGSNMWSTANITKSYVTRVRVYLLEKDGSAELAQAREQLNAAALAAHTAEREKKDLLDKVSVSAGTIVGLKADLANREKQLNSNANTIAELNKQIDDLNKKLEAAAKATDQIRRFRRIGVAPNEGGDNAAQGG